MFTEVKRIKKAVAVVMMFTVASFSSLISSSAMADIAPKLNGELSARGMVTLNGSAVTNATVFSGGKIKTGSKSIATINLGKMGQVELAADSEYVLNLEQGVLGGELRSGRATVTAPAGVSVNILTAEGTAVAEGKDATVMTVDVTCGNTRVASSKSDAKITAGNRVEIVSAGQEVAVGAQAADSARCPRVSAAAAAVSPAITGGALAALILLGVGAAVTGIVVSTQGDSSSGNNSVLGLSNFRP